MGIEKYKTEQEKFNSPHLNGMPPSLVAGKHFAAAAAALPLAAAASSSSSFTSSAF